MRIVGIGLVMSVKRKTRSAECASIQRWVVDAYIEPGCRDIRRSLSTTTRLTIHDKFDSVPQLYGGTIRGTRRRRTIATADRIQRTAFLFSYNAHVRSTSMAAMVCMLVWPRRNISVVALPSTTPKRSNPTSDWKP